MQTWKTEFSSCSKTIIMGRSNTERWAWVTCFSLLSGWNTKNKWNSQKISTQWNVWNAQKRKLSTASAHQLILQFQLLFLLCTGLHKCTSAQLCKCTTATAQLHGQGRQGMQLSLQTKSFHHRIWSWQRKGDDKDLFSRFWNISTIEHIAMHEKGFYARCKMSDGFCYLSLFLLLECSF